MKASNENRSLTNTRLLILCAFFAALTAVLSQISIPLPFTPVPLNLATLSVFLAGGLLGAKYGALSQFVYVLLGGIGLPVFHNFTGGFGILTGPTGGYLIGYILAALVVGFLIKGKPTQATKSLPRLVIGMAAGLAVCYALGTAWFIFLTGSGLLEAFLLCIAPFLVGDALKIFLAALLVQRLKRMSIFY